MVIINGEESDYIVVCEIVSYSVHPSTLTWEPSIVLFTNPFHIAKKLLIFHIIFCHVSFTEM